MPRAVGTVVALAGTADCRRGRRGGEDLLVEADAVPGARLDGVQRDR